MDADGASARRVFLICHGLRWLPTGLLLPITVLRLTERGLDLTQVGYVFAVYGAVTAACELPTGGLADHLGRRPVLLVATAFDAGFVLGLLLARSLPQFLAAAASGAVGRALLSGPLESWYVDTARAADPEIVLRPALAAAGVVEALVQAGGSLLSALLPVIAAALAVGNRASLLAVPIVAALAAEAASFIAVFLLVTEPREARATHERRIWHGVPALVAAGVRLATRERDLRLIFSSTFVAVIAMVTVELLWQPRFATLLGGAGTASKVNGFLVTGLSLASALGAWLANHLPRALRHGPRAAAAAAVGNAAAIAAMAASTVFAAAAAAFLVLAATSAAVSVVRSELLHDRVAAEHRTTMVSTLSLSQQAGNLVSSLTLARLADSAGIAVVWAIGAALFLGQALLLALVRPLARQRGRNLRQTRAVPR